MLTKTGWPRPIVNGFPVPWVSPAESLSTMNLGRAAACASGSICAVCGEGYSDDEAAFALVTGPSLPPSLEGGMVQAMDNGILHKRCLQLALAMCPKLKSLTEDGMLQIVETKGNIAQVNVDDTGEAKAVLDGEDCKPIDRAALKGA